MPTVEEWHDVTLINAMGQTSELKIFNSKVIFDLMEFKWESYAGLIHKVSLISHCCYLVVFTVFINRVYVYELKEIPS